LKEVFDMAPRHFTKQPMPESHVLKPHLLTTLNCSLLALCE